MKFEEKEENVHINLVPLLDTIFILLIFFSLLLLYSSYTKSVDISLPEMGNSEEIDEKNIPIVIKKDGRIFVLGKNIDKKGLIDFIKKNRDKHFMIAADKSANFGSVISVLDIIRSTDAKFVYFKVEGK